MYRFTIFLVICWNFVLPTAANCQLSKRSVITVQIQGWKTPKAVLGYYYGDQMFVADSTTVDTVSGTARFEIDKFQSGMYFIGTNKGILCDLILDRAPVNIEISGNSAQPGVFTYTGSPENTVFAEFEAFMKTKQAEMDQIMSAYDLLRRISNDPTALIDQENRMRSISGEMNAATDRFIAEHPDQLYALMLRNTQIPQAPASITPASPAYRPWMNRHYWDQSDFTDERMLRSKLWAPFLNAYLTRYTAPDPDSISAAIDRLLDKMPKEGPVFAYTLQYVTEAFEMNEWPPSDRIFVHLVDTWYQPEQTPWLDELTRTRLRAKAEYHRYNLVGNYAPSLNLPDADGRLLRLDTIKAPFTLLIFYSPLCEHCMDAMPDIYQTYLDARQYGLKAVAVNTDDKYENWKNFVAQQSWTWYNLADPSGKNEFEGPYGAFNLPVIYLLDKDKKILLKRIRPEALRDALSYYMGSRK